MIEVQEIGWILTILCWAPINAVSEQLSWIYVFDTFAYYYQQGRKKLLFTEMGFVLYIIVIGLVHALFWSQFLFSPDYTYPWSIVFFANSFITSIAYLLLYRKTKSMVHTAIIHLITDVRAVFFTGYSILPYLLL